MVSKRAQLICNNDTFDLYEDKIDIGRSEIPLEKLAMVTKQPGKILLVPTFNRISRQHATLLWSEPQKKYIFEDHSKYGTFVNEHFLHNSNLVLENKAKLTLQGVEFQILYVR
ncbi:FHA domain-containing protein [Candidatus Woesearchaeota archaeon]|nr:FHA domain-containing protein [Candidatus Woesearchaeota archaeon]